MAKEEKEKRGESSIVKGFVVNYLNLRSFGRLFTNLGIDQHERDGSEKTITNHYYPVLIFKERCIKFLDFLHHMPIIGKPPEK